MRHQNESKTMNVVKPPNFVVYPTKVYPAAWCRVPAVRNVYSEEAESLILLVSACPAVRESRNQGRTEGQRFICDRIGDMDW